MEEKVRTAFIKRDCGKVWGSTMPSPPIKTNQNEAKEKILGHPTGKIRGKRQRWSRGQKALGQVPKKIRCQEQGPTFRAETLSKAKNTRRKCSPKKKTFK